MDDSSEDDRPIGTRDIVKAATRLFEDEDSDVSGSPMPEWISQHTPVEKGKPEPESSSDSDGVVDLISQDPKYAHQNDTKVSAGAPADTAKPKTSQQAAVIKTQILGGTFFAFCATSSPRTCMRSWRISQQDIARKKYA